MWSPAGNDLLYAAGLNTRDSGCFNKRRRLTLDFRISGSGRLVPKSREPGDRLPGAGAATRRVIRDPTAGTMIKGASELFTTSPVESRADAPGLDPTAVCDGTAGFLPAVVHRPVIPHVLRVGWGVPRADRAAHRVRHADRRRAVAAVGPSPGAPVLLPCPVEHRGSRPGPGQAGRVRSGPRWPAGAGGHRRHAVPADRA